ncbi:GntR family transcriptional regulator [Sphingosinicella rhizophila]|uniref:GntR family transcriptional regulator n=1 Tax=Sphingosinicella rhizophila TaxID=3050082 RepID=A0ABU3QAL8_9SPHN|nr:GntR family transcriptional regulator [Sphingosinicella sp. GR2756]MDT9600372.1 GntR family transcriptional regulator [Sphingosinicella sp. GR2756]
MAGQTQSASDSADVYDRIMDAIVTQRLAPGQKVSENILTNMFGISRTAARNAMEQMTAQQFMISNSPRITRISPLTLVDVKENFTIRKMMEPSILSMIAPQMDEEEFEKRHNAIFEDMTMTTESDILRVLKANRDFNRYIAQQTRYQSLINWIGQLEDTTMRIYWIYAKLTKSLPFSMDQQKTLVDLVRNNQTEDIRRHVIMMITTCEDRVLNTIFMHGRLNAHNLTV